jgi:hypothetical protein
LVVFWRSIVLEEFEGLVLLRQVIISKSDGVLISDLDAFWLVLA